MGEMAVVNGSQLVCHLKYKKSKVMNRTLITGGLATESIGFSCGRQSLDHSVWYNGSLMTFLATGEETHGQFALIKAVARRGNVPPPHVHHWEDEIFCVLEGEIVVSVGDRTIKGTAGTMVFLPRDVPHSFTIESEQGRMLILLIPAGREGWFKEFSVPAPAMMLPPGACRFRCGRGTKYSPRRDARLGRLSSAGLK